MSSCSGPMEQIQRAAPCPARWADMDGNDRVRACNQCRMKVYNLSGLTPQDAEDLVFQSEKRLCVRYFQREDGTIITRNCPVGLTVLHQRRLRGVAAVMLLTVVGTFTVAGVTQSVVLAEAILSHLADGPVQKELMGVPAHDTGASGEAVQPKVAPDNNNPEAHHSDQLCPPGPHIHDTPTRQGFLHSPDEGVIISETTPC